MATSTSGLSVAEVSVPSGGLTHQARAAAVVWQREMIRFSRDRARMLSSLAQPLLFLFVLGTGLSSLVSARSGDVDFRTFLFPGVLATSVMFTAVFSAISIVWDRELGFLREMLVAPISRTSIVFGKCLGGATVATLQAVVLLSLAGLVGVPYSLPMIVGAIGLLFLIAFSITAFGLLIAVRVQQIQTVMPRVQLLLTPLMFLSGAFFPVSGSLPGWLHALTLANPLTYGVDALRRLVLHSSGIPTAETSLHWGDTVVPIWVDVTVVVGTGGLLLALAAWLFSRTD